jgi:hypothetical protein
METIAFKGEAGQNGGEVGDQRRFAATAHPHHDDRAARQSGLVPL